MRLHHKINLYTVVLFIVLLIIINLIIYFLFSFLSLNSELEQTQAETVNIVQGMKGVIDTAPSDVLLRSYVPTDGMIRVVLENQKGPSPVTSSNEKELIQMEAIFYENERNEKIEYQGHSYSFVSIPLIWKDGQVANLQITKSLERVVVNLKVLQLVLLVVTLIAMIPVVISSRVLSSLITTPITSIIKTMKEIRMSGRFQRIQLDTKRHDELTEMAITFNHMMDILESNAEKQEQFVSNASHELKTPLTVIDSYASLLKRRGKSEPELFDESVDAIQSEANRMREMTERLLMLAKPDEQWLLETESINLKELVQQSIQTFEQAYERKVLLEIEEEVTIESDRQILKQILYIFLDNARKYSEGVITITIGKTDDDSFIKISDNGIGIPKEDLPKIFDRFYTVDKARSRKHGGTGLGLSLAKKLGDTIGAGIAIDSLEGKGTTVTLIIAHSGVKKRN